MELFIRSGKMAAASRPTTGAFDRQAFREACDMLGRATALQQEPAWLFQQGFCEQNLGEYARATTIFARVVELARTSDNATLLGDAESHLQEVSLAVTFVVVRADPGLSDVAIVDVDGKTVVALKPEQLGKRVPVNPGAYRVIGKQGGRSFRYRLDARGGGETEWFPAPPASLGSSATTDVGDTVDPLPPPPRGCACGLLPSQGARGWASVVAMILAALIGRRSGSSRG